MILKEKVDSWLCEQGFVLTHMDNDYLRFDNVGMNNENYLETDVIIIKNKSKDSVPYSDYWITSYKECEKNPFEKIPSFLEKELFKRIESIVKTYREG